MFLLWRMNVRARIVCWMRVSLAKKTLALNIGTTCNFILQCMFTRVGVRQSNLSIMLSRSIS